MSCVRIGSAINSDARAEALARLLAKGPPVVCRVIVYTPQLHRLILEPALCGIFLRTKTILVHVMGPPPALGRGWSISEQRKRLAQINECGDCAVEMLRLRSSPST